MSLTKLRNEVRRLIKIKPTQDKIYRALCWAEIRVDELQESRKPTEKDLIAWFREYANLSDELLEEEWPWISSHLAGLR